MIDFTKKMKKSDAKKNDNPIDIYESLDRTSLAGPLRVSQEKVLRKWYEGKIDKKALFVRRLGNTTPTGSPSFRSVPECFPAALPPSALCPIPFGREID